jgi:hypothetical protein
MSYACLPKTTQMERNGKSINVVVVWFSFQYFIHIFFARLPCRQRSTLSRRASRKTNNNNEMNHCTLIDRVSHNYTLCILHEKHLPVFSFDYIVYILLFCWRNADDRGDWMVIFFRCKLNVKKFHPINNEFDYSIRW